MSRFTESLASLYISTVKTLDKIVEHNSERNIDDDISLYNSLLRERRLINKSILGNIKKVKDKCQKS